MAKKNDFDLKQTVYFVRLTAIDEDHAEWTKDVGTVISIRHSLSTDGSEISKYKIQTPPLKPEEEIWVDPTDIYVQEAAATKRVNELNAEIALDCARDKVKALQATLEVAEHMKGCAEQSMKCAEEALMEAEAELARLSQKKTLEKSDEKTSKAQ